MEVKVPRLQGELKPRRPAALLFPLLLIKWTDCLRRAAASNHEQMSH